MTHRTRAARIGAWISVLLAAALVLVWAASQAGPWFVSGGSLAVGVDRGRVEIGIATRPVVRRGDGWLFPPGVRVVVGLQSRWLPSRADAMFTVGMGGVNTVHTLTVVYVPLLFAAVLWLPPTLLGAWWLLRRAARCLERSAAA